ncbi:MAG: 2-oxoisovalerate dehydrogenase [Saprospiraceae bacterium]
MSEVIFMVKEADEGGYTASALGYSIFTEAQSWDELRDQVKEAVLCHFDDNISRIIRLHYSMS